MFPEVVGSHKTGRGGNGASVSIDCPSGVEVGELLVAAIACQSATVTGHTLPDGWSLVGIGPSDIQGQAGSPGGYRYLHWFIFPVEDLDDLETGWTWTLTGGSGRIVGVIFRVAGVDLEDPVAGEWESGKLQQSGSDSIEVFGVTSDAEQGLMLGQVTAQHTNGNSHLFVSVDRGASLVLEEAQPAGSAATGSRTPLGVFSKPVGLGATGNFIWVWGGTTAQRSGQIMVLRGAPDPTPPSGLMLSRWDGTTETEVTVETVSGVVSVERVPKGYPDVATMLATPGFRVAHRGGSAVFPEMTMMAYTNAAWAGAGALEISVWPTSDGVLVCSHDDTTGRVSDTSLTIPDETWATVSQVEVNPPVGALFPGVKDRFTRFDEVLDVYHRTHVLVVDCKQPSGPNMNLFFDLLDDFPDGQFLVKGFGGGGLTYFGWAQDRGHTTWVYFYDGASSNGSDSRCDVLSLNWDATQTDWDTILDHGKPVVGHVLVNEAQIITALNKGAAGCIVAAPWPADGVIAGVG